MHQPTTDIGMLLSVISNIWKVQLIMHAYSIAKVIFICRLFVTLIVWVILMTAVLIPIMASSWALALFLRLLRRNVLLLVLVLRRNIKLWVLLLLRNSIRCIYCSKICGFCKNLWVLPTLKRRLERGGASLTYKVFRSSIYWRCETL